MKPPRWTVVSPSAYEWEREALEFLREHLPDHDPWRAWSNFEFVDDEGRVNEVAPSETRRLGLTRSTPSRRSKSRDLGFGGPAIQGLESIDLAAKSTGKSTVGEPQFIGLLCIEIQAFLYCTISGLSHNFPDWRRV